MMSIVVNRFRPHIHVLPEDEANRQLANGFHLNVFYHRQRQMQILPPAGGWLTLLEVFNAVHTIEMDRNENRLMILLIDLDGRPDRLDYAMKEIPERLADRVFILSTLTEPEGLKAELGSFEEIGGKLADDCRDGIDATWRHQLLQHNGGELNRLRDQVYDILFEGE